MFFTSNDFFVLTSVSCIALHCFALLCLAFVLLGICSGNLCFALYCFVLLCFALHCHAFIVFVAWICFSCGRGKLAHVTVCFALHCIALLCLWEGKAGTCYGLFRITLHCIACERGN